MQNSTPRDHGCSFGSRRLRLGNPVKAALIHHTLPNANLAAASSGASGHPLSREHRPLDATTLVVRMKRELHPVTTGENEIPQRRTHALPESLARLACRSNPMMVHNALESSELQPPHAVRLKVHFRDSFRAELREKLGSAPHDILMPRHRG